MGWIQLIIAAAIAAAAASSSWWVTKEHYQGVIAASQVKADAAIAAANLKASNAEIDWEAWAQAQPAKIIYRDRKANAAFQAAPEWSGTAVPGGVRDTLAAAATDAGTAVAASAVPPASGASAADQSRSGYSLSPSPGFFRRLFSAPQSAGQRSAAPATP